MTYKTQPDIRNKHHAIGNIIHLIGNYLKIISIHKIHPMLIKINYHEKSNTFNGITVFAYPKRMQ
jgi:hypothetical protein